MQRGHSPHPRLSILLFRRTTFGRSHACSDDLVIQVCSPSYPNSKWDNIRNNMGGPTIASPTPTSTTTTQAPTPTTSPPNSCLCADVSSWTTTVRRTRYYPFRARISDMLDSRPSLPVVKKRCMVRTLTSSRYAQGLTSSLFFFFFRRPSLDSEMVDRERPSGGCR